MDQAGQLDAELRVPQHLGERWEQAVDGRERRRHRPGRVHLAGTADRRRVRGDPLGAHDLTGREVASTHVGKVGHGWRLLPLHS
jgi:hypothetical protein